jgi:hypothetical protein
MPPLGLDGEQLHLLAYPEVGELFSLTSQRPIHRSLGLKYWFSRRCSDCGGRCKYGAVQLQLAFKYRGAEKRGRSETSFEQGNVAFPPEKVEL